jgi:hypothetical protein
MSDKDDDMARSEINRERSSTCKKKAPHEDMD